jgi:HK97 family phage portal protein
MKTKAEKGPGLVKSALLNWLGFSFSDLDQWRSYYLRETASGERVGQETAEKHSTVYACTRLIAQRIATLPLNLYRMTADGRELVRTHPLFRLLRMKPNSKMTAPVFWEAVVASILLQRGAFLEKKVQGAGGVSSIGFLHPLRISKDRQTNQYRYIETDGRIRDIPENNVVHIPAFTTDGETGKSVIEYGVEAIGSALAADKAAGKTFKNGLLPTTGFKYPKVLKDTQRADAREAIETLSGAANAGKPIILEADMDTVQIGISPRDAQLLDSRQMSAEEICSLFGVPPTMIGRGDKASSWASSSEQLNLWFLTYTLMPWMRRIEAAITDGFLSPVEQLDLYVEYNPEAMLRGDTKTQQEFFASAAQNGYMSRNEIRKIRNLPPIPGGDIYTVQSSMVPIDQIGTADPGKSLRAALAAFLTEGTTHET